METIFPLALLLVVAVLVGMRRLGRVDLPPWGVALSGALLAVATGIVSPVQAFFAVHWDVLATLACLFVIGAGIGRSRLADDLLERLDRAPLSTTTLGLLLAGIALLSALVTNDAVAVIGTPFLLRFSERRGLPPVPLLLLLMAGVTTGAVPSPLGSPQNLLVASSPNLGEPFVTFLVQLGPPTVVSLLFVLLLYRASLPHLARLPHMEPPVLHLDEDGGRTPSYLALTSILILACLVGLEVTSGMIGRPLALPFAGIALAGAIPLLLGPDRTRSIRAIDWRTLVLFIGLFVLTDGVRSSGLVEASLTAASGTPAALIVFAVLGSQVVSNVPLVAIALPFVEPHGIQTLMSLAAGSTIAGHLTPLGAASNLIVLETAARRGVGVPLRLFVGFGLPLVVVQGLCYWAWLAVLG